MVLHVQKTGRGTTRSATSTLLPAKYSINGTTKVMFLGVFGRPRHNPGNNMAFDGKIGIFPFTEQIRAHRNSRNMAAGTMETKSVEVTKERYKTMLIDKVIPEIKAKFPGGAQQDHLGAAR